MEKFRDYNRKVLIKNGKFERITFLIHNIKSNLLLLNLALYFYYANLPIRLGQSRYLRISV